MVMEQRERFVDERLQRTVVSLGEIKDQYRGVPYFPFMTIRRETLRVVKRRGRGEATSDRPLRTGKNGVSEGSRRVKAD